MQKGTYLTKILSNGVAATVLVCCVLIGGPICAQDPAAPVPGPVSGVDADQASPDVLTIKSVQAKIEKLESNQALEESLKSKVLDLYRSALSRLETAKKNAANAVTFQQAIESAPQETQQVLEALKQLSTEIASPTMAPSSGVTAKDLEQQLAKEQADLSNLKSKLSDLDQQIKSQQTRPDQARQQLAGAQQKMPEIEKDLNTPPPADENPLLTEARQAFLIARKRSRSTEINMIEQELLSQAVRLNLLTAQRDLTTRKTSLAEERIKIIGEELKELRRAEADKARDEAERARRDALGKHPLISRLAEQNADLAKEQAQLVTDIELAVSERQRVSHQLKELETQYKAASEKLDIAGFSDALGPVLREQRKNLPNIRTYRKTAAERKKQISEHGLRYLRIQERRRELSDIQRYLEQLLSDFEADSQTGIERLDLETQAGKFLEDQRSLLDKLTEAYSTHLDELSSLNFQEKQLVEKAGEYALFLDEKLLWIPSAVPVDLQTFHDLWESVKWSTSPRSWMDTLRFLGQETASVPALAGLVGLGFVAVLAARKRIKVQLDVYRGRVGTVYADRFGLTIGAFAAVFVLAIPWPFLMGFIAWRLQRSIHATDFAKAVGAGLATASALFLVLEFLRLLCRKQGVAEVHLQWRDQLTAVLRRHLRWMMPILVVTGFIAAATEWRVEDLYRRSFGRIAFIVGMIALAAFAQRLLGSRGGVVEELRAHKRNSWMSRLMWLWYPIVVGAPLALAGMAVLGYYYTSYELAQRLVATGCLALGLILAHDLVLRWLFVAQRKLEVTRAREKQIAATAAQATSGQQKGATETPPPALEFPEITLEAINEHTRRLVRTLIGITSLVGLWLVWEPVLPALRIFDDIELWQQAVMVDGHEVMRAITLANLALAFVLAIVTVVAARNLPGVLEIVALNRLPLEPGSRYAIATISRYLITAVGIGLVFNALGIGWAKFQWLVAALGVGLGFGLQEIFANFISGLIILFERPFRVGDTVTVGQISGTVSRLQIRATTITDWDRKELIVPNKEFITGQLVNWTLSDATLRIVIRVGVAYGSDTKLARETLIDVAKKHPLVLRDPPPSVVFWEFGDSSLNFDLRVFVGNINNLVQVRDDLHMAIDEAFRKAELEIAFPQQDMHMDTARPLEVRLIREKQGASKDGANA